MTSTGPYTHDIFPGTSRNSFSVYTSVQVPDHVDLEKRSNYLDLNGWERVESAIAQKNSGASLFSVKT